MHDIVIGRSQADREKLGTRGAILLGKQFITMGQTQTLSNKVHLDVTRAHVVFICGKRGGGKSYTMGVVAEGLSDLEADIAKRISIILVDTMGVYWTMKYPNKKDASLLNDWGIEPKGMNVIIHTPIGSFDQYKKEGIPTDIPFAIRPAELDAEDWTATFSLEASSEEGIVFDKVIRAVKEEHENYGIDTIIAEVQKQEEFSKLSRERIVNLLENCKAWGLFSQNAPPITELATGGAVSVLDVSCYATQNNGWAIKNLVVGLVAKKLFVHRMVARKKEEFDQLYSSMHYYSSDEGKGAGDELPLVWLVLDEAHEFLPVTGKTAATDPLVTILREGRQPGISLMLATQQPGKIHTDVMTQSDTVIAHRITAKMDVDALGLLMQSYMRKGLVGELDNLPRLKGAGIIFDDTNERMYPIRVRPRTTWHGGESPNAVPKKKKFDQ